MTKSKHILIVEDEPAIRDGLGLALVKSLSDRMGLKVWFENRSPGCEFLLQIPVSKSVESS